MFILNLGSASGEGPIYALIFMTFAPYESLLNVTKCVRCRLVLLDSMGKLENKSLEICHLQSFIKHSFSLSLRISDKWIRMTSACRLMWLEM